MTARASEGFPLATPVICDRCGRNNPNHLTFCQECGKRLSSLAKTTKLENGFQQPASSFQTAAVPLVHPHPGDLRCGSCGTRNGQGNRFCVSCGVPLSPPPHRTPVTAVVPAAPSPVPPPARAPKILEPAARLTTVLEDGTDGTSYLLDADPFDLGREEGSVVLPNDPYLSPRHARFFRKGSNWLVRDLDSLNGVYARLTRPVSLVDGDLLLIGLQVLKFALVNGAEQALGPAKQHGTLLFGSPIFPRYARLCQRTVEGVTRNVFYLHKNETTVGRESGDIVFSDDAFLSRRHLVIRRDASRGTFTVEDLDSSNGTYLAIRGEIPLENGTQLRLGQHLFRFDLLHSRGEGARRVA